MIGLRHLAIRARDLARSRRFYEEGLGLTWIGYRPSGVAMDLTDGHVNLTLLPYVGPERAPLEEGSEFIHLGYQVDDVTVVFRRLVALGAVVVRDDVKERRAHDPDAVPVGSFKALDPDGNVLDISDRPDEWRTRVEASAPARAGETG
jgi:catechol 2,3-dioxygenase-like lactoylglutathione lyase family enzyme